MKNRKMIASLAIILCGFIPVQYLDNSLGNSIIFGTTGTTVPNPAVKVGELQDKAYTYTGADIVVDELSIHIDDYVTVVVIDNGLTGLEWRALEQNPEATVDIVGFVTEDEYGTVQYITNPYDSYLDDQVIHGHGFNVISALGAVARDVKVIFMDIDFDGLDPYGFEYGELKIWQWINNNRASKDIDIVSWSMGTDDDFTISTTIKQIWENLLDNDVILLTAAGKFGNYLNRWAGKDYKYQSYYSEWYSVGSIDHETRPLYSTKNSRSFFSPWYESTTINNQIINWLEPGNGIPMLVDAYLDRDLFIARGTWKYGEGTSLSTPYLAGIIALAITGYHNGIGSSTDPSLDKLIEILRYASSRSTFDQKLGYGYVDAYLAYGKGYTEGGLA